MLSRSIFEDWYTGATYENTNMLDAISSLSISPLRTFCANGNTKSCRDSSRASRLLRVSHEATGILVSLTFRLAPD